MKIRLVCVGKIKENFYRDAIAEYAKRLSRFCKLEIVEIAEENDKNTEVVKLEEGKRIVSQLKGFACVLDMTGNQLSSVQLADKIRQVGVEGCSEISFVIGGSFGLDNIVLNKADLVLSFGKATYPHQLMRVILTEQIYRAFMINEGSAYHK